MLSTIIFEKDRAYRKKLQNLIQNRISVNDSADEYNMEVSLATDNIFAVKEHIDKYRKRALLLFVSLETLPQDLEFWKELKDNVAFVEIVYLSDSNYIVPKIIHSHTEPLDIVSRDLNDEHVIQRLRENIDIAFKRYNKQMRADCTTFFSYEIKHGFLERVPFDQVYSIESILNNNKYVFLVSEHFVGRILGSLKHLEEKHQQHFFRCNRTTLINVSNVTVIDKKAKALTLSNGKTHIISTRRIKKALSILEDTSS